MGRFAWPLLVCILAAIVLVPLLTIGSSFLQPVDDVWAHFADGLLTELVWNTLVLLAGVLSGTFVLGTGLAWLIAVFEFPGRRWLEWLLVLPFAFPTYVMGFVMLDLFGLSGPVTKLFRNELGELPRWYPSITSAPGVALVMSLAFYPYVYLLARNAFRTHGRRAMEAARSLGHRPARAFFRLALPMARPWIFGGLLLVAMETLADFGTVTIFNYDTFTTAIYKAWYGMFSLTTAARMATILLGIALIFLALDRFTRAGRRYYPTALAPAGRMRLSGPRGWVASAVCWGVLGIAFLLPLSRLAFWSLRSWQVEADAAYWRLLSNTLKTGLIASFTIGIGAVLIAYAVRIHRGRLIAGMATLATMGYALPGTVLAVAIFIPVAWLDNRLPSVFAVFGWEYDWMLNGTMLVMFAAYFVRFLAVAQQPVQASLDRIRPALDESARSLGHSRLGILGRIHLPLLRTGLVTAMLLVLVDVMKEMPITLMTRPFDWDTLAVRIYELTSEGEYERAALPSAILVLGGLIPVFLLARFSETARERNA